MIIDRQIERAEMPSPKIDTDLLTQGLSSLAPIASDLEELAQAIDAIAEIGDRAISTSTRKLQQRLRRAEPSVTMIGQVKSGKTSLVNAMIGCPDLLPADVNPWTSVVTSIHLSSRPLLDSTRAMFRFFEQDEWKKLMQGGGRLGELAGRAGADDDLAKVAAQLETMRAKSMNRLGDKFELLMGQEHKYGFLDPELVERYVCLGDDFETDHDTSTTRGRFADITKSADLYMYRPEYPVDLCIRDTPGVNDTFMMREQITMRAIRESRSCVVVLSAHQAMSTVDLALIRLIANIPSRSVVIFVNRIDELPDPGAQAGDIAASIRKTIRDHHGPEDAQILFGSAYWANNALRGTLPDMNAESTQSLINWAEAETGEMPEDASGQLSTADVWHLSGIPRLFEALSGRVSDTVGREVSDYVARSALNLAASLETSTHLGRRSSHDSNVVPMNHQALPAELDRIEQRCRQRIADEFERIILDFHQRLDRAHAGFVDRATGALIKHLETHGDKSVWSYDPTGLRILLRTAFQVFARRSQACIKTVYEEAAAEACELYVRGFGVDPESFTIEPPAGPILPPPVFLGQTIALDMNVGWWTRWWRARRGYRAYAADFADLINSETAGMVETLKSDYGAATRDAALRPLMDFVAGQRQILNDLALRSEILPEDLEDAGLGDGAKQKAAALASAKKVLARHLAPSHTETH
ncbi:dynamin family protein [Tropicimonas isoalkanivorans]|uniref:Dynamin family protein n=1 Tax=Tropicimonas isoalkanivorans TaxID=441112 RepID=A0A1I1KBP8_9RHOB|nr:dynamin family protein [Tropicimonas isoalkanivorans]SFC58364.1 Dynamin family protein [Tropicimonas isoalkanivorans]